MHSSVGCVLPACLTYSIPACTVRVSATQGGSVTKGGYLLPGGVCYQGGVWYLGGVCYQGGVWYLGGVCYQGVGVPATWGCVCYQGVSATRGLSATGGCLPLVLGGVSRHAMGKTPPSLWTDRHLWKHNLRKLHLRAVKILVLYFVLFFHKLTQLHLLS